MIYNRYPFLIEVKDSVNEVIEIMIKCYETGGKVLLCGNGGSAADCDHIAGELMKGFLKKRPVRDEKLQISLAKELQGSLPTINLASQNAFSTAFANDMNADYTFAQQVYGLGNPGDILLAISTSGQARNILHAIDVATAKGLVTIGLTGCKASQLLEKCDYVISVPASETYKIQELHLPIYHEICAKVESHFFVE